MTTRNAVCWFFSFTALLAFGFTQIAHAQGWPGSRGGESLRQLPREVIVESTGFLFVDGEYLPPPYRIRVEDNLLLVNDRAVKTIPSQPVADQGTRFRRPPGGMPRRPASQDVVHALSNALSSDQIVVHLPDQPEVIVEIPSMRHELLKLLVGQNGTAVRDVSLAIPAGVDQAVWNEWIAAFEPSDDFVSRVTGLIERHDRTVAENLAEIGATRRLHTLSYPLSVFGMLLTTVGMGHLLSQRPPVGSAPRDTDANPLALRAAVYSLGLVALFSALDLAWTLLASQAGQMRELNPLGSHLIENPAGLIAFKVGATALAIGLLLALRKYKRAQLAAWWVCLICTLLTARWVMLNSMFIA